MISGVLHGRTFAINQICCSFIMIMKPAGCQYGVGGSRVMREYLEWTGKATFKEMGNMVNIYISIARCILDSYYLSACPLFRISICPSVMFGYLWNSNFEMIHSRYKFIKVVEYNFDTFHFFLSTIIWYLGILTLFIKWDSLSVWLVGGYSEGAGH